MLIGDIPKRNAGLYPDKAAVIQEDATINHSRFNRRINSLANSIIDLGLVKGDRVTILQHNCYQYIEIYFALAKIGMPTVPLSNRYSTEEILYIIKDSGARMIFFGKDYFHAVKTVRDQVNSLEYLVCIDDSIEGISNYEELISKGSDMEPPASTVNEEDIVILAYTGGTTGNPKGVMVTHRNLITSCYNTALERLLTNKDVLLNIHPIFHAGGANSMFAFSFIGATNVILNTSDIDTILKTIQNYKITHLLLVPTLLLSIIEHPNINEYDLSCLNTVLYGTAPISLGLLKKAMRQFKCKFSQTYGMTETFVPISILKPGDHILNGKPEDEKRMSSAGREVMGVQVKIVDNDGQELEREELGEIAVKGDNVMKGYWNQPELTREVLKDGWLHTGDIGKMDKLRYIYIIDRKKDMIISGGLNIYPKEIENILRTHPAVKDAVVIGVPDDKWGEAVKGVIIKKNGEEVTEKEIIGFCKDRLAKYKAPKSVEFVNEFPKSSAGKVLKRELRDKYWKDKDRKV